MQIDEIHFKELAFLEMEEIKERLISYLSFYGLDYELECRVKSIAKLKQKIALHIKRGIIGEDITDIKDIIGLRIIVKSEEEVIKVAALMQDFMTYDSIKDQFTKPRYTGFKAYTYYYSCFGFNTEIQIMTASMRTWTNKTHEEHDKRKYEELKRVLS